MAAHPVGDLFFSRMATVSGSVLTENSTVQGSAWIAIPVASPAEDLMRTSASLVMDLMPLWVAGVFLDALMPNTYHQWVCVKLAAMVVAHALLFPLGGGIQGVHVRSARATKGTPWETVVWMNAV